MAESALLASLITSGAGLLGVVLSKCKMIYKRDDEGNCSPICAFPDKSLLPGDHEIEVFHEQVGTEVPVLIINDLPGQYLLAVPEY